MAQRERVYAKEGGRHMTRESERASTDINGIMEKWVRTGIVPQRGETPSYGDFSSQMDFHTALTRVRQAEDEFMNLPPHIRKFCANDPGRFLDLVMDADGRAQLEQLGMVSDFAPKTAPEPSEPPPAEPVNPSGDSE